MNILAIDTSGQTAGVAIVNDELTLGEISINAQKKMTHSEILLPAIDRIFAFTGLTLADMDYIACVNGPGSFTGLRIGAATAKGLAEGAEKPLVPVPALEALAYNIGYAATPGTFVVPMMDARRMQVYTAVFRCDEQGVPARITEYMAVPVEEIWRCLPNLTDTAAPRVIFLGDGAAAYADILRNAPFHAVFAPVNANRQRAASVGMCARRIIDEGYGAFALAYIRKPQAERELLRAAKGGTQ